MTTPLPANIPIDLSRVLSRDEAQDYTRRLSRAHYENFSVVSWFLPKELRQHFFNVYAYCRWSDDLADETGDPARSLELLDWWKGELRGCYAGHPKHPVFVALAATIERFNIPSRPFEDLLSAFVQDQTVTRYPTFEELRDYCRRSADPVGRLVLYLGGYRDEERQRLSDSTCTALQLANFWQDVARDWDKGRVYLPLEDLARCGVAEEQIRDRRFTPQFGELMRFEVERTRQWFAEGLPLLKQVDRRLRRDLELFTRGGQTVLDLIERQGYDVLSRRPVLTKAGKVRLMLLRLLP
ncbi:MAG TPA: squalene synthase HpnC [Armatimonadota bacterium]|jgi:squalene synthase HpnC